jgi:hypothetical protein
MPYRAVKFTRNANRFNFILMTLKKVSLVFWFLKNAKMQRQEEAAQTLFTVWRSRELLCKHSSKFLHIFYHRKPNEHLILMIAPLSPPFNPTAESLFQIRINKQSEAVRL